MLLFCEIDSSLRCSVDNMKSTKEQPCKSYNLKADRHLSVTPFTRQAIGVGDEWKAKASAIWTSLESQSDLSEWNLFILHRSSRTCCHSDPFVFHMKAPGHPAKSLVPMCGSTFWQWRSNAWLKLKILNITPYNQSVSSHLTETHYVVQNRTILSRRAKQAKTVHFQN